MSKQLKEHVQHEFEKFDKEYFRPWIDGLVDDFEFTNTSHRAEWNGRQIWDGNKEDLYDLFKSQS